MKKKIITLIFAALIGTASWSFADMHNPCEMKNGMDKNACKHMQEQKDMMSQKSEEMKKNADQKKMDAQKKADEAKKKGEEMKNDANKKMKNHNY